ncbi:MAG: tRNA/rRNA methyltransferase [Planctomycetota bacterium]|jgi:tRNA/rRNA methyltransferase
MIRIILCRPAGPRNVGMILRISQNFGPCELYLVDPGRPSMLVHPEFVQMSHGVEEAKAQVVTVATLTEALAETTMVVGFTARVRGNRQREDWREMLPEVQEKLASGEHHLALVFGAEEMGLTKDEVDLCHRLAHVRTSEQHTSLNLAVSVGVILSGLFTRDGLLLPEPGGRMLSGEGREFLKKRMIEVFGGTVARSEKASELITASIERVFSRAELEDRDARAWHLMLRALGNETRPDAMGLEPNTKGGRRERLMQRHKDGEAGTPNEPTQ